MPAAKDAPASVVTASVATATAIPQRQSAWEELDLIKAARHALREARASGGNRVLRANLGGNPSFRELVRRVKETTLGAYENQDVPFERLVQELRLGRETERNPLFDVMFTLQNVPEGTLSLPGLQMIPLLRPVTWRISSINRGTMERVR